jgi:hypothetical protein
MSRVAGPVDAIALSGGLDQGPGQSSGTSSSRSHQRTPGYRLRP